MSYGPSISAAYRQAGVYVVESSRARSQPNFRSYTDQVRTGDQLKTAEALGLDIPPTLLARADEVIE